jgi:hypothetical protein
MEIHRWGSIIELSSVSIQSLKMRRRHVDRLRVPGLRRGEEDRRRRASSDLIDGVRHASCTSRSQMSSRASARLAPEGTSGGGGASFSFRTPPANYLFVRVCAVSGATPWKGNKQQTHSACSLFGWLVADGWCWFVLREEYCWLVAAGCWWLVRSERKVLLSGG